MRLTPARTLAVTGTFLAVAAAGAAAQTPPVLPPLIAPTVAFSWERDAPPITFTSFRLKNLGDDSTVVVRCLTASGDRCKGALRKAFRAEGVSGTVEVKRFVGRRIRPGRRLEARITKSGWKTVYKTVTVRRSGPPTILTECSEAGSGERGPC